MSTSEVKTFYDYERVARLIETCGKSQVDLAKEVKVSPVTISRVKTGTASQALLAIIGRKIGFDYRHFLLPAEAIEQIVLKKITSDVDIA